MDNGANVIKLLLGQLYKLYTKAEVYTRSKMPRSQSYCKIAYRLTPRITCTEGPQGMETCPLEPYSLAVCYSLYMKHDAVYV